MRDPAEIMSDLDQINQNIALIENEFGEVAGELERLDHQWKYQLHFAMVNSTDKAASAKIRESQAMVAAAAVDDLWDRKTAVEAGYAAAKTRFQVLDRRASVLQSILRALTQEQFRKDVPQPAWSRS